MFRAAPIPLLLPFTQACATAVESRVTDPAAIAEARAAEPAGDPTAGTVSIVVLRLKVDATGAVRDAQVVQSAGAKYDQEAVQSAYRLRFNPAYREDGQPVESTFRFAFKFSPGS